MTVLFDKPVVCPITVGRAAYLEALERAIQQVASGQGQLVLLAGEAGIGKSRLVAEAKTRALQQGFSVLQGNCFEPNRSLPYAPFLDLVRMHLPALSPVEVTRDFGSVASELVSLLPELASLLLNILPSSAVEPEQAKRRLFAALTQFFARQAAYQPLLLVVEDLHWCDEISLEFLLALVRRSAAQPLLTLATYRSDELNASLAHWLAQLDRARLAQELALQRLTPPEVDTMVRTIFELNRPVRPEVLGAVYALSEGNPFFIEEILKSLVTANDIFYGEGGWQGKPLGELHIPRSVQDAVRLRTRQLSEDARQLSELAAVAGQRFDFALLHQLTGCDERELLRRLKELIAAQLVVEESSEQFAFRHALTRQAIYAQLLARERKALHQTIGETIERLFADTLEAHWHDLAYHSYEAGEWQKALEYETKLAEKAQGLNASRAAIEHYSRALEAASHLSLPPQVSLMLARASEYEACGETRHARDDYEHALAAARNSSDLRMQWLCLINLATVLVLTEDPQSGGATALSLSRAAVELAQRLGDPALHAHSLACLGTTLQWYDRGAEGLQALQQALHIYETLGDKQGIAETLDDLGVVSASCGDRDSAEQHFRRALILYRELGDIPGEVACLGGIYKPGLSTLQDEEEGLRLARQIGWLPAQAVLENNIGMRLANRGQLGPALAHLQQGIQLLSQIDEAQSGWLANPVSHAVHTGAAPTAEILIGLRRMQQRRRRALVFERQPFRCYIYWDLGLIYLFMLEPARALENFATALSFARAAGKPQEQILMTMQAFAYLQLDDLPRAEACLEAAMPRHQRPYHWYDRWAAGGWGRLLLAQHEPAAALQIAEQALETSPPNEDILHNLWTLKGDVLLMCQRPSEAEQALAQAKRICQERSWDLWLWEIHRSLGRMHLLCHCKEQAQREFETARQIIQRIAATIDDTSLRENFLRTALATLPAEKTGSVIRTEAEKYSGLTLREREVAFQIAQGKANADIAAALVLSERTVESHVRNILNKLGYTSRAQVAVWVVEKGLLKTDLN